MLRHVAYCQALLGRFDKDSNGVISIDEFLAEMVAMNQRHSYVNGWGPSSGLTNPTNPTNPGVGADDGAAGRQGKGRAADADAMLLRRVGKSFGTMENMRRIFSEVDRNHSNYVTAAELKLAIERAGLRLSEREHRVRGVPTALYCA